jgi:hypothetical protein
LDCTADIAAFCKQIIAEAQSSAIGETPGSDAAAENGNAPLIECQDLNQRRECLSAGCKWSDKEKICFAPDVMPEQPKIMREGRRARAAREAEAHSEL